MELVISKDIEEVTPLNRLWYVKDTSDHLTGKEISEAVSQIIKYAPDIYNNDDIRQALEDAIELVYGED